MDSCARVSPCLAITAKERDSSRFDIFRWKKCQESDLRKQTPRDLLDSPSAPVFGYHRPKSAMSTRRAPITLGVEEEVFVLEQGRLAPTLQSLDYLRRLYWKNPRRYTTHSASNFAKKDDRKQCFMGSIEIASGKHGSVSELLNDLIERRKEFAKAAEGGVVVPTGGLFTLSSPTNTASTHIHVGVPKVRRELVYGNLAYFVPVLAVAAANSPWADGKPFGLSYRMSEEGLLGPLREDREYRFQDIIISKRLGTIEIRVFDPIPELWRLRSILEAIVAIASSSTEFQFDRGAYNLARKSWTRTGADDFVKARCRELNELIDFPIELAENPISGYLCQAATESSVLEAYHELDRIWRAPTNTIAVAKPHSPLRGLSGLAGYYAIRLPYIAYKGYKEWYGKQRED